MCRKDKHELCDSVADEGVALLVGIVTVLENRGWSLDCGMNPLGGIGGLDDCRDLKLCCLNKPLSFI